MHEVLNDLLGSPMGPLFIFLFRIVDVSCDTMRVILAVRGRGVIAAILGFFQALIWIFAVGTAIQHLDSLPHVLGYSAGFAAGTFVGITIEQAVAMGLATVRIVSPHGGVEIANALRERGYGATEFPGFGREGKVEIVNTVVHRNQVDDVVKVVEKWDPQAFVTVEEPRVLRGGSFTPRRPHRLIRWTRWRGWSLRSAAGRESHVHAARPEAERPPEQRVPEGE